MPKFEPSSISYFQTKEEKKEPEEKNELNFSSIPLKNRNRNENGGNKHSIPKKRNFKDIYLSKVDENINEPKEKMSFQRMDINNESSYINSFYNEPSFINKIRREENSKTGVEDTEYLAVFIVSHVRHDIFLAECIFKLSVVEA